MNAYLRCGSRAQGRSGRSSLPGLKAQDAPIDTNQKKSLAGILKRHSFPLFHLGLFFPLIPPGIVKTRYAMAAAC